MRTKQLATILDQISGNMPVRIVVNGIAYGVEQAFYIREGRCFLMATTPEYMKHRKAIKRVIRRP